MASRKGNAQEAKQPLLKILMLHGYRQSESAFRERTGGLRKSLKSHVDFVFCESPHLVPKLDGEEEKPAIDSNTEPLAYNDRGWWFSESNSSYDALLRTDCDLGFDKTLDHINSVFEEKGPFDGILGFSQGACLAGILSRIAENNSNNKSDEKYRSIKFGFAIIVAGFKSGQSRHDVFYDLNTKIALPTLHIYGETDKVIPFEMSEELTKYFLEPNIIKHAAGHLVPVNAEAKNNFIGFFNAVRAKNGS
jgi:predicted esterase